jgi:pimeloyl-ACP methyl ester carboxylesterase
MVVASLVAALLPGAAAPAAAVSSDPEAWAKRCGEDQRDFDKVRVALAPALRYHPERNPDGSPIRIRPDSRGRYVPVIMVHGWVGKATHVDEQVENPEHMGAFSHLIDLTTNRLVPASLPRSLIGQLQRIPGAAVFTFDYRDYAARWINEKHLGPALGKTIDCLYQASGQKVIIVGHSMGGLVARWAATHSDVPGVADRSAEISTVVTFGTPETGSIAAMLLKTASNAAETAAAIADPKLAKAIALIRLFVTWCGRRTSDEVQTGTLCDSLPLFISAFDSDAGRALRYGSPELEKLDPFPRAITVDALAGETTFHLPKETGWFGLPWRTTTVDVGDIIVTRGSAQHGTPLHKTSSCAYELSFSRGVEDTFTVWVGLRSKVETAQAAVKVLPTLQLNALAGPCFHTQLMRGIELTNEATGAVNDDIAARQPVTARELLSAPVPAACDHNAGKLVKGELPGIPPNQGEMRLAWLGDQRGTSKLVASGDLNADGNGDAATVLYCNAGGVSWPELIAFYTHGPKLLGFKDLGDINLPGNQPGENAMVYALRYVDGAVEVTWATQQKGDAAAWSTLDYAARLRWDGRRIVVSDLSATTERPTAEQFTARVRDGDMAAADKLAAPGVAAALREQLRAYPAARSSAPRCLGLNELGLGSALYSLVAPGSGHEEADRLCLLPAGGAAESIVLGMRHTEFRQWQVAWVDVA